MSIERTNTNLVEFCKDVVGHGYWYGCFGQLGSDSLYRAKKNQYPDYYQFSYDSYAKDFGSRVCDCAGLIKWFLWSDSMGNKAPTYKASEDKGATGFYNSCTEKGFITSMPELEGILLFKGNSETKSHVGVYIGNGKIIEARGHNYGVVQSGLDNSWKYWGKCCYITYNASVTPSEPPQSSSDRLINVETYQVRKGSVSLTVKSLQTLLKARGYSDENGNALDLDGEFGKHTDYAVRTFQKDHALEVDGIVGKNTWRALLNVN